MELLSIVSEAIGSSASDVHFKTGARPFIRNRDGELLPVSAEVAPCSQDDIKNLIRIFLASRNISLDFLNSNKGEIDGGCIIDGARLRYNAYHDGAGISIAIRILRSDILNAEKLGLPFGLRELMHKKEGLILFCGATGSGKTTAMYALLDEVNQTQRKHIITLDDPIEIVLPSKQCLVSQREIGTDSESFATALRSAVREDPDILLIGEIRDKETVMAALAAAETGHLVLSTIHSDLVEGIPDRILPFFPSAAYAQVRAQLANSFVGMVGCRMLPRKGGGRIGAYELLLKTYATAAAIRAGNTVHLKDYMTPAHNMQTMEMAINGLKFRHLIEDEADA